MKREKTDPFKIGYKPPQLRSQIASSFIHLEIDWTI